MINRILMELYDEYEKGNINALEEFTIKTFGNLEVRKLFMGCTLILFNKTNAFKGRYDCTREELLDIVLSLKEKKNNIYLMKYYLDRVNKVKGIFKYFKSYMNDNVPEDCIDVLIDYLEQFKPSFKNNIIEKINL